jgi:hypothetical protein
MSNCNAVLWPAIASAIAAIFAAFSSYFTMRIHKRNLLESVRPELVLENWASSWYSGEQTITINEIKNIGRGVAYNISLTDSLCIDGQSLEIISKIRIPILAPNESNNFDGKIIIKWESIEPNKDRSKNLSVTISISCFDSRNQYYETKYNLFIEQSPNRPLLQSEDEIVLGVKLENRKVIIKSAWRRNLAKKLMHNPIWGSSVKE